MSRESAPWGYFLRRAAGLIVMGLVIGLLWMVVYHFAGWKFDKDVVIFTFMGVILGEVVELKWRVRDR